MGDIGGNEPKRRNNQLLIVLGIFHFDLRVDFASPNQPLFSGGGGGGAIIEGVRGTLPPYSFIRYAFRCVFANGLQRVFRPTAMRGVFPAAGKSSRNMNEVINKIVQGQCGR
ncbi:unnamed protein product, partial [Sphacelaria rigidula]